MKLFIFSDNSKRTWIKEMDILYVYCSLSRSFLLVPYQNCYWNAEVVFEYECEDILDADRAFEEKLGKKWFKNPYIGCQIIPLIFDEETESENIEMAEEHWTNNWKFFDAEEERYDFWKHFRLIKIKINPIGFMKKLRLFFCAKK